MNLQQDDDIQQWTNTVRETHQVVYPNLVYSASLDLVGQENSKIYFGFFGLPMKRSAQSFDLSGYFLSIQALFWISWRF